VAVNGLLDLGFILLSAVLIFSCAWYWLAVFYKTPTIPVCAVYGCNNSTNINRKLKGAPDNSKVTVTKASIYSFPKDDSLRQQLVHLCKRNDKFNPSTARIRISKKRSCIGI
jgi:hypothetical protein